MKELRVSTSYVHELEVMTSHVHQLGSMNEMSQIRLIYFNFAVNLVNVRKQAVFIDMSKVVSSFFDLESD